MMDLLGIKLENIYKGNFYESFMDMKEICFVDYHGTAKSVFHKLQFGDYISQKRIKMFRTSAGLEVITDKNNLYHKTHQNRVMRADILAVVLNRTEETDFILTKLNPRSPVFYLDELYKKYGSLERAFDFLAYHTS